MPRPASRPLWMLLAAVALLGAGALAEMRRERMIQPQPLTALKLARVHRISVECPDCTTRRFERIQGQWGMVAPYTLAADAGHIERLLAIAHAPTRRRFKKADIEPSNSGLDKPAATLTLDDKVIVFGATDAITGERYLGHGSEIALIADRYLSLLQAAPEAALDKHPITPGMRVLGIEVDGETLAPTALTAWKSALATAVRPSGAAATGRTILVRREDGGTIGFVYFEMAGDLILRRETPALDYVLDAAQVESLALRPEPTRPSP